MKKIFWQELLINDFFVSQFKRIAKDNGKQDQLWQSTILDLIDNVHSLKDDDPFLMFFRASYHFYRYDISDRHKLEEHEKLFNEDFEPYVRNFQQKVEYDSAKEELDCARQCIEYSLSVFNNDDNIGTDTIALQYKDFYIYHRELFYLAYLIYALSPGCLYKQHKFYALYQRCIVPQSRLRGCFELLSFRKFNEYSLQDLIQQCITVVKPKMMNDPIDTLYTHWADLKIKTNRNLHVPNSPFYRYFDDRNNDRLEDEKKLVDKYYRIRSFTKLNYKDNSGNEKEMITNTLMWSHYTMNHKGFAIQYSFDADEMYHNDKKGFSYFHGIDYSSSIVDISGERLSQQLMFLTKSSDWAYEHEIRLVDFNKNNSEDFVQIKGGLIKAIYFGKCCENSTVKTITDLFSNYSLTPKYYRMRINPNDVYTMKVDTNLDKDL